MPTRLADGLEPKGTPGSFLSHTPHKTWVPRFHPKVKLGFILDYDLRLRLGGNSDNQNLLLAESDDCPKFFDLRFVLLSHLLKA
jgi:hypothetical protein